MALFIFPVKAAHPQTTLPEDNTSAVILAYHRIGEDSIPESNLRIEQFEQHINEIVEGHYNVISIPDLVQAIKSVTPLPPKTIAITFEGGFQSAYQHAFPLLLKQNIPFTVFFSSGLTERENYLSWKELKQLSKNKHVTLGILPSSYTHIIELPENEQSRLINKARADFKDKLSYETQYFSYPFGETSNQLKKITKDQEFAASFSLKSGPAYKTSDLQSLPRFTMTESYGDIDRFRMITQSLPLPITDIEPQNAFITTTTPSIGFTIPEALENEIKGISCFISEQSKKPEIEILGRRIELRPKEPLQSERTRINCTLPARHDVNDNPRWRWLGMLLTKKSSSELD